MLTDGVLLGIFRLLLVLQVALFALLEDAELTWLRITQFGVAGNAQAWSAIVGILRIGFVTTYLVALFISVRSWKFLGVESLPGRLAHLGMTATWPIAIWLGYGVMFGYSAS